MTRSRTQRYQGVVVPMVTPFTRDGQLDELAVRRIIDHLLAGGVAGVFVLGTTGEDASVPYPMRSRLVALTVEHVAGRALVYAGVSDNSFAMSLEAAEAYARHGVDALVAHLPSYYELSPDEQLAFYTALAAAVPAPLMLYNIPSTTHMSIPIDVIARLAGRPNIIGLKDSERDEARLTTILCELGGRDDFAILAGTTAFTARALALGADGSVPSAGNLAPELCRRLHEYSLAADAANAERYQSLVDQVGLLSSRGRSLAQSLGALKAAMGALDLCEPHVLPPLPTPGPAEQAALRAQFLALRSGW